MKKQINCSNDYIIVVARWVKKFSDLMRSYSNAAVSVLAYYLRGSTELITCPNGMDAFKEHGEAMRNNGVMFAAAEDSGLLAEAVPEVFRLALENHNNWCVMNKDISFLLQHPHLRHYIPFEYRFLAEAVTAINDFMLADETIWEKCIAEAKGKLRERQLGEN